MSRRAAGEGTTSRRADGRIQGRIDLGWSDGKRIRKYFYGRTRQEVLDAMKAAQGERDRGFEIGGREQLVGDFLRSWLRDQVAGKKAPGTVAQYQNVIERHVIPGLGAVPLKKLNGMHVDRLLIGKTERGELGRHSASKVRGILRVALNYAKRNRLVLWNAAADAEPVDYQQFEGRALDPEEAMRFLEAARGDRLEALYCAALALGLRRSEALGLRWGKEAGVDLDGGRLRIRHGLQRVKGRGLVLLPVKTKRSRRDLVMPDVLLDAMHRHRQRQLEERIAAGPGWIETGYVFTTPIGTPLDPDNMSREFSAFRERIGVPSLRFYDLRHSMATLLMVQGVQPRVVMAILGHSSINHTMNTYSHVLERLHKDAATAMDAVLGPRPDTQPDTQADGPRRR